MNGVPGEILSYFEPGATERGGEKMTPTERFALEAIDRRITSHETLDGLMDDLFESTREICPCHRMGIAFVEEDGRVLTSRWNRADYGDIHLRDGYSEGLAGSSLQPLLQRGAIRIIRDLPAYLACRPQSRSTRLIAREGIRSSMTCPLRSNDRVIGALFRSSRDPDAYDRHQAHLHTRLADRLSQAVEKAYRIRQLRRANEAYRDMLGFVAHELKNPLGAIVMDADLLLEGFLGALPDEHRERVGKMRDKATYLLDMVRDYLNLARLEEGTLQASIREDVDFGEDVLEPARSLLEEALRKKGMTLAARTEGEVGPLAIDPDLFRIVMTNLIGNAVKYGREGGEIRVLCDWPPGGFSCAVWNEGPGFSPAMRTRLFHKFSRLPEKPLIREKGSGVGLYVVQQIVLLHDGRVDARSEPGQWAEFSFTIPRRPPIAKGESA